VANDLDAHVVGVAAARAFDGHDLDLSARCRDGLDVAVNPLDLDDAAGGQRLVPAELALLLLRLGRGRATRSRREPLREGGERRDGRDDDCETDCAFHSFSSGAEILRFPSVSNEETPRPRDSWQKISREIVGFSLLRPSGRSRHVSRTRNRGLASALARLRLTPGLNLPTPGRGHAFRA
jgi:hypothetical protein